MAKTIEELEETAKRAVEKQEKLENEYGDLVRFIESDRFNDLPEEYQEAIHRECSAMYLYVSMAHDRLSIGINDFNILRKEAESPV